MLKQKIKTTNAKHHKNSNASIKKPKKAKITNAKKNKVQRQQYRQYIPDFLSGGGFGSSSAPQQHEASQRYRRAPAAPVQQQQIPDPVESLLAAPDDAQISSSEDWSPPPELSQIAARNMKPSYHDLTDGEHSPQYAIDKEIEHQQTLENIKMLETIDQYNIWIGNKLRRPVAHALQTLFVTHGIAPYPSDESGEIKDPSQTVINALLNHGILLPKNDNAVKWILDSGNSDIIEQFRQKYKPKQQHLITMLDSLVKLDIVPHEYLKQYQVGVVNPFIPFKPRRYTTNPFDSSLELMEEVTDDDGADVNNVESNPETKDNTNEENDDSKNNKPKKLVKKFAHTTIADIILDTFRMAGIMDVRYMDLESLQDSLANPHIRKKQFHPPPENENHLTPFPDASLQLYNPKKLQNHPVVQSANDYKERVIDKTDNLVQLLKLYDLHQRVDITYQFRQQFDSIYARIMAYRNVLDENGDGVIKSHRLKPQEIKLFKGLIYDCYLQKAFTQHYLHTPLNYDLDGLLPDSNKHIMFNLNINTLDGLKQAQEEAVEENILSGVEIKNNLKRFVLEDLQGYPTIALESALSKVRNKLAPDALAEREQKIREMAENFKKTMVVVPPEANYKKPQLIKFMRRMYDAGLAVEPPEDDALFQDPRHFVMKFIMEDLELFEYRPDNNNNPENVERFEVEDIDSEQSSTEEQDDNDGPSDELTDDNDNDNNNNNTNKTRNNKKNKKSKTMILPTEEEELLALLVSTGAIDESEQYNFQPLTYTPYIDYNNDSPMLQKFKQHIIDNLKNDVPSYLLKELTRARIEVKDEDDIMAGEGIDIVTGKTITQNSVLTPEQRWLTKPYIISTTQDLDEQQIPLAYNDETDRLEYYHPYIQVVGYERTENRDAVVSKEIVKFDQMLSHINDMTQLRTLLLQYFRHDVFMDFALQNSKLVTKLIGMDYSNIINNNIDETDEQNTTLSIEEKAKAKLAAAKAETFTNDELNEIKWLISKLHLQKQLISYYKLDQDILELDPLTGLPCDNEDLAFWSVVTNNITDKSKDHYINNLFNDKYLNNIEM